MSRPYQVREVVGVIKELLEAEFAEISVLGEVSNFTRSNSQHVYFSLVDGEALINIAFFASDVYRNPFILKMKNGDKVVVSGGVSVYSKRGSFQLIGKKITPHGQGDLRLQLEVLKRKLSQEGLFDLDRKKIIPKFPKKIALITAPKSAAVKDFIEIAKRRSSYLYLVVVPALVQGEGAVQSLIGAFQKAEKIPDVDLIVVTRGGGSFEDLFCFNDENLIRAIARISIPVISAIGHEIDTTLCDFVADKRCETPSAAAEFVTAPQLEVKERLNTLTQRLKVGLSKIHTQVLRYRLRYHPKRIIGKIQSNFLNVNKLLMTFHPRELLRKYFDIRDRQLLLDDLRMAMVQSTEKRFLEISHKTEKLNLVLNALGPQKVLSRGFTYLHHKGKVISRVVDLSKLPGGTRLDVVFKDGTGHLVTPKDDPSI